MTYLLVGILLIVAVLAALPWLTERRRLPMDKTARRSAPGHFVRLSDGETHYEWHGPARGPVLVLIHGLTTPSWVFAGLVRGLGMMGFRVLSYDLYGRGFSSRPTTPETRHFFIRQLRELLDVLGVDEPVALLGYSMGGAIATIFAAEEPTRVSRLILVAPAGIDYTPAPLLARARETGLLGDWLWGLLGAREVIRASRQPEGQPSAIPEIETLVRRETQTKGYLPAVLSAERHMLTEYLEDEHRALGHDFVPVLSVWGEEDGTIPLSSLGKLTEWNRGAYKVVIPGAGHGLVHTHPREILDALQEHLREV